MFFNLNLTGWKPTLIASGNLWYDSTIQPAPTEQLDNNYGLRLLQLSVIALKCKKRPPVISAVSGFAIKENIP